MSNKTMPMNEGDELYNATPAMLGEKGAEPAEGGSDWRLENYGEDDETLFNKAPVAPAFVVATSTKGASHAPSSGPAVRLVSRTDGPQSPDLSDIAPDDAHLLRLDLSSR